MIEHCLTTMELSENFSIPTHGAIYEEILREDPDPDDKRGRTPWEQINHPYKKQIVNEIEIHEWNGDSGLPYHIEIKAIRGHNKDMNPYDVKRTMDRQGSNWSHWRRRCRGEELNNTCSHHKICDCIYHAVNRIRKGLGEFQ